MKLFNTMSGQKEEFQPSNADGIVRIYACGITPYDTTHGGHAFLYTTVDILARYLQYQGHQVRYVQNVTDIDDDILKRAAQTGDTWDALGQREIEKFLTDMDALNVRRPDVYARATEETPTMIEIIQGLLERNHAYIREGNVYFRVSSDPYFGKLSHLPNHEAMLQVANQRGNFPDDSHKENPLDFVLWQAAKPGEPTWPSPWGEGRPGWHIECSAMALRYLGPQIDVHAGGADLIFPHHECEIAQTELFSGRDPFVRTWFHVGMLKLDGEKMSKSLGNLIMIKEELKTRHPDAIRLYLMSQHYRESWEWLRTDAPVFDRLAERLAKAAAQETATTALALNAEHYRTRFTEALDDDLNTPLAMGILDDFAGEILNEKSVNPETSKEFKAMSSVLGLTLEPR